MLAHERTFINIPYKRDTFSKWNFTDANKRVVFLFPWFFVFIKALSKRNSWFPYSKESTGNKREKMSIYIEEDKFRDWNRYKKTKNVLIYLSNDIIYVIIFFHKFNFTECPAYAKSILYVVYYISLSCVAIIFVRLILIPRFVLSIETKDCEYVTAILWSSVLRDLVNTISTGSWNVCIQTWKTKYLVRYF